MAVSPSFPAPGFPELPQAGEPRHDAVSPSFPELPHQFPQPVSPPPLEGRGSGETTGTPAETHPERPTLRTFSSLPDLSRAMEALS